RRKCCASAGTPKGFGLPGPACSLGEAKPPLASYLRSQGGAGVARAIFLNRELSVPLNVGGHMHILKVIAAIVLASSLAACASVTSGTSQTLRLDTVPPGADCALTRNGMFLGRVNPTPGTVKVQRARDDITVSCVREGYQTGTFVN